MWGQEGVRANVSVVVRNLPQDALSHATPITLSPTTPPNLTRGWAPQVRPSRGLGSGESRVRAGERRVKSWAGEKRVKIWAGESRVMSWAGEQE